MDVSIIEDQGTHLLICRAGRCAIVERRNNRLYTCHEGKRESIALDAIADIATILDDGDWIDKATAQASFNQVVARGTQLSQTMR